MNEVPIKLTYLTNEWDILEKMAREKGAKNFRGYVRTSLTQLANNCPVEQLLQCEKKSNNYIIPSYICQQLTEFARQRKIPLASLVKWYVSDPLLKEFYEAKRPLVLR